MRFWTIVIFIWIFSLLTTLSPFVKIGQGENIWTLQQLHILGWAPFEHFAKSQYCTFFKGLIFNIQSNVLEHSFYKNKRENVQFVKRYNWYFDLQFGLQDFKLQVKMGENWETLGWQRVFSCKKVGQIGPSLWLRSTRSLIIWWEQEARKGWIAQFHSSFSIVFTTFRQYFSWFWPLFFLVHLSLGWKWANILSKHLEGSGV